ncbi:MAG: hypothetical protein HY744_18540 [Deltaproteobacteria bacterium]|nr:hypothetical protein [Deltaproteobacteria bacterium]
MDVEITSAIERTLAGERAAFGLLVEAHGDGLVALLRQLLGNIEDARCHLKSGLLLVGLNGVPIIGSVLFLGILLAGVGATLLGYFGGAKALRPPVDRPATPAT